MRERCYAERADDTHMDPKQPLRMRIASQSSRGCSEHEEAPSQYQYRLAQCVEYLQGAVLRSCSRHLSGCTMTMKSSARRS